MEWYCRIRVGGAHMDVHFTGGSMTGRGNVPAKYMTENPLVQTVIENSAYYKEGRIQLISVAEGSGRYQVAGVAANESADAESKEEPPKTTVEVSSLAEAKDYLVEKHGVAASKLRSRAAIIEHATSFGIEFTGV